MHATFAAADPDRDHREGRRPTADDPRAAAQLRGGHTGGLGTRAGPGRVPSSDVAGKLPALSAYLGHAHPASTYWYLSGSPNLLASAARRLEQMAGELR